MIGRKDTTVNDNLQQQQARTERQFLAILVCVAQLKLLLLRERADSPSWHKRRVIDKLVDGVQFITHSLEDLKRADSEVPTMCHAKVATVSAGVNVEVIQ